MLCLDSMLCCMQHAGRVPSILMDNVAFKTAQCDAIAVVCGVVPHLFMRRQARAARAGGERARREARARRWRRSCAGAHRACVFGCVATEPSWRSRTCTRQIHTRPSTQLGLEATSRWPFVDRPVATDREVWATAVAWRADLTSSDSCCARVGSGRSAAARGRESRPATAWSILG